MDPKLFVVTYLPFAISAAKKSGYHKDIFLTAGAQESGWGEKAIGFNFFGIKDNDGINGNEVLITTTEYSKSSLLKFPVILKKVFNGRLWKYTIKDYFRKYSSAEASFLDYANFFKVNPRYKDAYAVRHDPILFFRAIHKAGYATDPNYSDNLINVLSSVRRRFPK